jgi:hypothetical protein
LRSKRDLATTERRAIDIRIADLSSSTNGGKVLPHESGLTSLGTNVPKFHGHSGYHGKRERRSNDLPTTFSHGSVNNFHCFFASEVRLTGSEMRRSAAQTRIVLIVRFAGVLDDKLCL